MSILFVKSGSNVKLQNHFFFLVVVAILTHLQLCFDFHTEVVKHVCNFNHVNKFYFGFIDKG